MSRLLLNMYIIIRRICTVKWHLGNLWFSVNQNHLRVVKQLSYFIPFVYLQLSTTYTHINNIFSVPQTVAATHELIQNDRLLQAHKKYVIWCPVHSLNTLETSVCVLNGEPFDCEPRAWNNSWQLAFFPTNFYYLAKQVQFARANLLYISSGEAIDSLWQCYCF